jgi:glycosyltransferase involved in cell wall biosynthesis
VNIGINASALSAVRGGASFYIFNIVNALAEVDSVNKYFIFTTNAASGQFPNLPPNFRLISGAPARTPLRLLWEQSILPFALCKKYKIRVLFSPNYTAPVLRFGVYSIVTIHDLSFFPLVKYYPRTRRLFRWVIRLSVKHSNAVIAVSNFTKCDILKFIGPYGKKISVVYEAADPRFLNEAQGEQISAVLKKYRINREYILFIGFLEPRKNLERLLRAYSMIKDSVSHDLVIAGGQGWWYERTYRAVTELGISDRVVFTGYVDDADLPHLYKGAALFAFPSLYEGFGIAALEAVFSGTPVLASNNSALPEILGDAAAYADPFDTAKLASEMERLLTSREALSALKKNCRGAGAKYSWQKAARETLALFGRAAER